MDYTYSYDGFDATYNAGMNDGIFTSIAKVGATMLLISSIISVVFALLIIIANWKMYKKANKPGWAILVPLYNWITLSNIVYGNGGKIFLMLIPIYNIYFVFKFNVDLAHAYGKSTGFGILSVFLNPICRLILGFGKCQYVLGNNQNTNIQTENASANMVQQNAQPSLNTAEVQEQTTQNEIPAVETTMQAPNTETSTNTMASETFTENQPAVEPATIEMPAEPATAEATTENPIVEPAAEQTVVETAVETPTVEPSIEASIPNNQNNQQMM